MTVLVLGRPPGVDIDQPVARSDTRQREGRQEKEYNRPRRRQRRSALLGIVGLRAPAMEELHGHWDWARISGMALDISVRTARR